MKCEACGHENVDGARFCAGCGALMPGEAAEGEDPLVGQVVGGRYRITGVLGEGGMGVVYVGEQQMGSTVRKVAVKTLHPQLSKDPSVLTRFHRECGTVAQLEHPNTIKFYDFGATSDGTLYIAMEFVKGTSLDQVIEQGPMSVERALKIMKQICGALDEAHEQGIIHRDLKPENVILTSRAGEADTVKVLDFGIAARSESADAQREQKLTQQGMVLGTPPYMSPEQFTGKALDRRSDIYSLGVMAYEMLTGSLPFEADTPWQWATQHMTAQPRSFDATAPTSAVPSHLRRAIMRALSKEREERQSTAKEFFAELSAGGGLTVDEAAAESVSSAGTAAMEAVPDFGAAAAPTAGPAAPAPMAPAPPMGGAPGMAPAAVPVAPPPARGGAGAGGKLLVGGLVALAGLIALAFVVVLVISFRPEDEPEVPLTNPFSSAAGEISVRAEADGGAAVIDAGAGVDAAGAEATATAVAGGTGGGGTTSPGPQPGDTGGGASTPSTGGGTGSSTPKPSGAACDACISAASAGNITGAAANYRRCDDASKKGRCKRLAAQKASGAARRAALNGNCAQAKAIIAAAKGMGAGSGRLDAALRGSSCQ